MIIWKLSFIRGSNMSCERPLIPIDCNEVNSAGGAWGEQDVQPKYMTGIGA